MSQHRAAFSPSRSTKNHVRLLKMTKMFLMDRFRAFAQLSSFAFAFHTEEWGECESERKAFPTCSGVDDGRVRFASWASARCEARRGEERLCLLSLWPCFPVGWGWGVSFGQTGGNRGRAAYVCMSLKLAVVFLSHTVGLSSCFHCPSLLPRERREEEREMLLTVHCHKHKRVLNGRTEWRRSGTIFSFLFTYYYFHRCLCAAEFNQKRSNMKIRGKNTNLRDRCYKMKQYTLRCVTVLV